jgi:hypothetical protein
MSYGQLPDIDEPLSEEERDSMIGEIAQKVVDMRMETPAVLFLEMNKPVSVIAGQSIIAASPILIPLFGAAGVRRYSQLLNNRENVELLVERIEDLSIERDVKTRKKK